MQTVSGLLRDALGQVNRLRSANGVASAGIPASVGGFLPTLGARSIVAATRQVNEQTSTVRQSSAPLGLDVTSPERASVLSSTAEANTALSSYQVVDVSFQKGGNSQTSRGRISGFYSGTGAAANATSLKLQIASADTTIGATPSAVSIKVSDQLGTNLGTYSGTVATGGAISLGPDIGLSISFTAGTVLRSASTTFTVAKNTPTNVDPEAMFNNPDLNLRPRFEKNAQVTAGSFTLNSATVSVLANDTIHSVLNRINNRGLGVTASFAGDKVTFQTSNSSEDDIRLAGDTSGFLSALKLTGATTAKGNVRDDQQRFAKTSQFSSVVAGSFSVNGKAISVDPGSDSLQSLIARINGSGAGVTAAYDSGADQLVFTPNTPGATLVLENDTSGFLTAAKIQPGAFGTKANPDAAFNGTGSNSPLFEQGVRINAGSFLVNNCRIEVAANDTLNRVLGRITSSSAGVTASYDSLTDRVTLTAKQPGLAPIILSQDTSGFLAAVKLDGTAQSTVGTSVFDTPIADHQAFAQVRAGTISINRVAVSLDPATNTLEEIIGKLNQISGVSCSVDAQTGRVSLRSRRPGGSLEIADNTGLMAALNLPVGKINGQATAQKGIRDDGQTGKNATAAAEFLTSALERVNEMVDEAMRTADADPQFKNEVLAAVRLSLASVASGPAKGLEYTEAAGKITITADSSRIARALRSDPHAFDEVLSGAFNLPDALDKVLQNYGEFSSSPWLGQVSSSRAIVLANNLSVPNSSSTQSAIDAYSRNGAS